MKGYYCVTGNDKDLFFIPWVLAARETIRGMKYYHSPEVLEELTLAIKENRINRFELECKNWEIREFDIPNLYIKPFIDACFKKRKRKKIKKFSEEIYGFILELVEEEERREECYEDEEDYYDDWWKRGDKPTWE